MLGEYFSVEVNATRKIVESNNIRGNIHYKSDIALPFKTIHFQIHKVSNIFREGNDPMEEYAKV